MCLRRINSANGDGEIRTLDPLLARQVLSQLSYTPASTTTPLCSNPASRILASFRVVSFPIRSKSGFVSGKTF